MIYILSLSQSVTFLFISTHITKLMCFRNVYNIKYKAMATTVVSSHKKIGCNMDMVVVMGCSTIAGLHSTEVILRFTYI